MNISIVEIYKETIKDLISGENGLKIKEEKSRGVYIEKLTSIPVVSEEEILELVN